ncbi:MAG: hypothetical protein LBI26_01850, partial [Holosporales bacterium]|nr:hypothetical protein [Holosporales bacterium]
QQTTEEIGYFVLGSGAALNIYIYTTKSSLNITESPTNIIAMYFLRAPALALNLSSFTNLVTLDAGGWDKSKVSLDDIKARAHPTSGVLKNFVAPDNLDTISTNSQFGDSTIANSTKFDSFTARGLKTITGVGIFRYAVIDTLNLPSLESITVTGSFGTLEKATINTLKLPSLTTITGVYTFSYLNTNGNPLSLPKLVSITGSYTFYKLMSSTLTLRTNLKISKPSSDDNFYYCCSDISISDTFLNLLYSTNGGTPMNEVNLSMSTSEPITGTPGQWRMNATGSEFLTKLKTITLRPAESMPTPPSNFTIKGAPWNTTLTLGAPDSEGVYTWTKPST